MNVPQRSLVATKSECSSAGTGRPFRRIFISAFGSQGGEFRLSLKGGCRSPGNPFNSSGSSLLRCRGRPTFTASKAATPISLAFYCRPGRLLFQRKHCVTWASMRAPRLSWTGDAPCRGLTARAELAPGVLGALKRLDDQARRLELYASGPSVEGLILQERQRSPLYGGRN